MSPFSLKRSFSVHSSDTEPYETPVKRRRTEISSPCNSENTPINHRVRTVSSRGTYKEPQDFDLSAALQQCGSEPDQTTVENFKGLTRAKIMVQAVQSLLHTTKVNVKKRVQRGTRIIETELYLQWLQELDFVVNGVENLLNAKVPGTRRRVKGLGRVTFAILYCIIDGFISDVDNHHDGWSFRESEEHPTYPATMTLAEEAKDASTDKRADKAVRSVETWLKRYDTVMGTAARRLKAECGRSAKTARMVAQKERTLARACCLLCEQTGFGGEKSGTGDSLLQTTRELMRQWKAEYGITDDNEYDSRDEF